MKAERWENVLSEGKLGEKLMSAVQKEHMHGVGGRKKKKGQKREG